MPARQIRAVRLPVHYLKKQEIIPYLRQIGWSGEFERIQNLVERYFDLSDRIAIDLDIGPQLFPQLGLELHLHARQALDPRWVRLLDQLVSDNLCHPAQRDAF